MTQACLANTNFELPASEQDTDIEPPDPSVLSSSSPALDSPPDPSVLPASSPAPDSPPDPSILPASDSDYEPEPEVRFEVTEKITKTGAKKGSIHYSISLIIGCHTFKRKSIMNMLVGQLSPNFQDG